MRLRLRAKVSPVLTVPLDLRASDIANGALSEFEKPANAADSLGLNSRFLEDYLMLGFGTTRDVYELQDDYVIKVATGRGGIAQNRVEQHISSTSMGLPLARVVYAAKNYLFLVVHKADALDPDLFLKTYGMDFDDFAERMEDLYQARSKSKILKTFPVKLQELLKELADADITIYDLDRVEQWGDIHNVPVIVDYGLNPSSWIEGADDYSSVS